MNPIEAWAKGRRAAELEAAQTEEPDSPATPALLSVDELTSAVQNACELAAIEVDVWETDLTGSRTTRSPLRRLVRCLRSAGLLDERADDEDAL
jgi:hypothetical protein